ncbi:YheC/YheD family protein [Lentibacillus sp. N15]|uniref:YheC/YheD family protein n=1 Tax=Lentibacillus songyuanensis TaxID=3136161 RepID=UPI0031BAFD08
MTTLSDKELIQVTNIFHTLLEATEHFHKLIKDKEIKQSVFIFSSIVDGFGSVSNLIPTLNNTTFPEQKNRMETYLLEIAQLLEKGNLIKISEILQFSFQPLIQKMCNVIDRDFGDQNKNKRYSIGVFASFANPRDFYPEPRVNALVQESEKQNVQLLFLTSNDVDFDKNEVAADVCVNGKWQRITAPFPDVINNVGAGKRSHIERKLRRIIPFTNFHVGNKFYLPKRMVQYRKYAKLLVPFRLCRNTTEIHDFLENNNKVVFKALSSNRGENIFFVTKKGNRYVILEHKKEHVFNQEAFHKWLQTVILRNSGSYIVQRYIHTRTKDNEPYHIRAHVQKNGEGKWVLTHIYPSVGNKNSNLSNVSTGGKVEDFHTFLEQEYGKTGATYEQDILRLSIEVAQHLDKLHDLALDELGLDFAIDENGRYWMHEANNGPQTAYHEEKRAVNTIAYAKYIAKNGIVHTENVRKASTNMFQAKNSTVPFRETTNRPTIGILTGQIVSDKLAIELAQAAEKENIQLYSFTPQDIDYDEMLIKGYFYEEGEWIPKIVAYPDVIFDRIKLRGDANAKWIYEELEEIPFTNEWATHSHTRSEIYERLQAVEDMQDLLSPFQKVARTRDIFRFIEQYEKVLLKPEIGSLINETQYIEKRPDGKYVVTKGKTVREYNEFPLLNTLKDLIKKKRFIVQEDDRSFDSTGAPFVIHMHHMLNKDHEWDYVSCYSETHDGAKEKNREELTTFLQINYEEAAAELETEIKNLSKRAASALKKIYGKVSEVALVIGIDYNKELHLMEINPNGPETFYDVKAIAKSVVAFADSLLTRDNTLFNN